MASCLFRRHKTVLLCGNRVGLPTEVSQRLFAWVCRLDIADMTKQALDQETSDDGLLAAYASALLDEDEFAQHVPAVTGLWQREECEVSNVTAGSRACCTCQDKEELAGVVRGKLLNSKLDAAARLWSTLPWGGMYD